MSQDTDPQEAQAIERVLGNRGRDVEVVERDFRRPRRLSAEAREGIKRSLEADLPQVEKSLANLLGERPTLSLEHVRETTAEGLFEDVATPLAALVFEADGSVGWLMWESRAAIGAVETVLGCPTENPKARRLSAVEAKVLERVLVQLAGDLARPLGLTPEKPRIAQATEGLGSWRDAPSPDAHRVEIAFVLAGPSGKSKLSLYLPGVKSGAVKHLTGQPGELPEHLAGVQVHVCARLRGCEISLDQLLALEAGDVIPIEARVGDPATLTVEGFAIARAQMGKHRDQLAVRIERLESRVEEME